MNNRHSYPQIVPWTCKEEWLKVYENLYSNDLNDLQWAVDKLAVWQARCPTSSLLGVETTGGLVRARVFDLKNVNGLSELQKEVSIMYAMAIIRFVNLMCEICKSKSHVTPIKNIAQRMGIPEWLVNLRNYATHKQSVPSLDILRTGSNMAMEWLRLHYWEKEKDTINDFVLQPNQTDSEEKISNCLREFEKVQYSVLYEQDKKVVKMNRTALQGNISSLRKLLRRNPDTFIRVLSLQGFLVPEYSHLEALLKPGETEFKDNSSIQLPLSLEKFWSPVFSLFRKNDHVQSLLNFLLEPSDNDNDFADRLSAAWALHILNIISSQECGLFNFNPSLNWLQTLEIALKKPTKHSPHILLAISENAPLGEDIKQVLMTLVAIFLGSVSSAVIPKKVGRMYSLEDVLKVLSDLNNSSPVDVGPWKMYSGKTDWQKMPIGTIIQAPKEKLGVIDQDDGDDLLMLEPVITEPPELENMVTNGDDDDDIEEIMETSEKSLRRVADLSSSLLLI